MATTVPSWNLPLYTVPKPPCPILNVGEKFLVAALISSMVKFTLPGSLPWTELAGLLYIPLLELRLLSLPPEVLDATERNKFE
jgi:hypothetical protein